MLDGMVALPDGTQLQIEDLSGLRKEPVVTCQPGAWNWCIWCGAAGCASCATHAAQDSSTDDVRGG